MLVGTTKCWLALCVPCILSSSKEMFRGVLIGLYEQEPNTRVMSTSVLHATPPTFSSFFSCQQLYVAQNLVTEMVILQVFVKTSVKNE